METRAYIRIAAAALAGIPAGILMMFFLCTLFQLESNGLLIPLQMIAVTLIGEGALLPSTNDFQAALVGLSMHLVAAMIFGAVFGMMTRAMSAFRLMLQGAVYGLAVWALMFYFVLPSGVNYVIPARMDPMIYLLAHLIFGSTLGLSIKPIENKIAKSLASEVQARPRRLAA